MHVHVLPHGKGHQPTMQCACKPKEGPQGVVQHKAGKP